VADLPFPLSGPLAATLTDAIDVERKIPRALDALGPIVGRDVALVGAGDGLMVARLAELGSTPRCLPLHQPFRLEAPDASLDAVVTLWDGFRGPDAASLAETDRALRPGGRLLVVHDYGRDDVSGLRDPDSPEYTSWSRRDGPFLRTFGFRVRVLHCFWTFPALEDAQAFLADAFGERGVAVGAAMRRPRLSWNVAVYHRARGGELPTGQDAAAS
jgi:SAM-dependent methyltransferase